MRPSRISWARTTPASRLTPAPVAPPEGPWPAPSRLAHVAQLVTHSPATRRACQKSQTERLAGSTTTIAPSEPAFGDAAAGIRSVRFSRSQRPQGIVHVTCTFRSSALAS